MQVYRVNYNNNKQITKCKEIVSAPIGLYVADWLSLVENKGGSLKKSQVQPKILLQNDGVAYLVFKDAIILNDKIKYYIKRGY